MRWLQWLDPEGLNIPSGVGTPQALQEGEKVAGRGTSGKPAQLLMFFSVVKIAVANLTKQKLQYSCEY